MIIYNLLNLHKLKQFWLFLDVFANEIKNNIIDKTYCRKLIIKNKYCFCYLQKI